MFVVCGGLTACGDFWLGYPNKQSSTLGQPLTTSAPAGKVDEPISVGASAGDNPPSTGTSPIATGNPPLATGTSPLEPMLDVLIASNGEIAFTETVKKQAIGGTSKLSLYMAVNSGTSGALADQSEIVKQTPDYVGQVYRIRSSSFPPELYFDLAVRKLGAALSFTVVGVGETAQLKFSQVGLRIGMNSTVSAMSCDSFQGYTCSNADVTVSALCISAGCVNFNELKADALTRFRFSNGAEIRDSGAATFLGVDLAVNKGESLLSRQFAFVASRYPAGSIEHRKKILTFLSPDLKSIPEPYQSTYFLVSDENTINDPNKMPTLEIIKAAQLAKELGFSDLQILDVMWQRSRGGFHPKEGLADTLKSVRSLGLKTRLHHLAAEIDGANPLYNLGLAKNPATNSTVFAPNGVALWDPTPSNASAISQSFVSGLSGLPLDGIYLDGFEEMGAGAQHAYLSNLSAGLPTMFLEASTQTPPNLIPWLSQGEITDRWQVRLSKTPSDWARRTALPELLSALRAGFTHRLGWIPVTGVGGSAEDYELMLNAAVSVGAPITMQGSNGELSGMSSELRSTLKSKLATLRKLSAEKQLVSESGTHIVTRFANASTSVGIFGMASDDTAKNPAHIRAYGAKFFDNAVELSGSGSSQSPAYGAPRAIADDSYLVIPPSSKLIGANGVTIQTWVKISSSDFANAALLIEKPRGYGIYYAGNGIVNGHLNPTWSVGEFAVSISNNAETAILPDQWNHVAYTYDPASGIASLYINGKLASTTSAPKDYVYAPDQSNIYVGAFGSTGGFKGFLSGLRMYDRTLSKAEIGLESSGRDSPPQFDVRGDWSLKTDSNIAQRTINVESSGPSTVYVVPLDKAIFGALVIQFKDLPANASCQIEINGIKDRAVSTNPQGSASYEFQISRSLQVSEVKLSGCR
jgi:hypothetical protein